MDQYERTYLRFQLSRPAARRHKFRGQFLTAQEIADATGIRLRTVHRRLQYGLPIEGPARFGPKPRQFAFRGRFATIAEIMEVTGLSRSQVGKRTDGVKFFERHELTDPHADPHPIEHRLFYRGINDSICGWSRRTGIPHYVIRGRISMGWSIERALTQPAMERGGQRQRNRRIIDRIATITRHERNAQIIRRMIDHVHKAGGYGETSSEPLGTGAGSREIHSEEVSA